MNKSFGRVGSFLAIAGLFLGASSRAEAALCATRTGTLSVRDICKATERTVSANELGLDTSGGGAASTPPKAFAGYNDGTYLPIWDYETPAYDLSIPEAGSYLITAKVNAIDTQGDNRVSCRLYANAFRDEAVAHIDGEEHTLAFTFTDTFASAGKVRLSCWGDNYGAYISWIKINAVKVTLGSNSGLNVHPDHSPVIY